MVRLSANPTKSDGQIDVSNFDSGRSQTGQRPSVFPHANLLSALSLACLHVCRYSGRVVIRENVMHFGDH